MHFFMYGNQKKQNISARKRNKKITALSPIPSKDFSYFLHSNIKWKKVVTCFGNNTNMCVTSGQV